MIVKIGADGRLAFFFLELFQYLDRRNVGADLLLGRSLADLILGSDPIVLTAPLAPSRFLLSVYFAGW